MWGNRCPRCDVAVALHEGRPHVTSSGGVELWHRGCWDARDQPTATAGAVAGAVVVAPARRTLSRKVAAAFAGAAIGVLLIGTAVARATALEVAPPPPDALSALGHDDTPEPFALHTEVVAREVLPGLAQHVETAIEARWPVPMVAGTPLDELYPTLRAWTHPVVASAELMPEQTSRHFGTPRLGVDVPRPECGEGHCGVDLDGPRGRAIVAVANGVVVRVERSELGLDGKSGRYVRIVHDDGTFTAYMHLDDVADELEVGNHVSAGQYLGTLGATATYGAVPHLHFSLEIPNHGSDRSDSTDTHYVDPAPFLVRSDIAARPLRILPTKPAF